METFQRNYPGVLPKNGTGLGLSPFGGKDLTEGLDALRGMVGTLPGGIDWRLLKPQVIPFDHGRVLLPRSGVGAPQGGRVAPVPRSGERLGIVIKEMPEVLRTYLELSPGAGLMVDSVQSDTLAEALGLKANDIVMSINDRRIHSPASVQKALADIPKGDVVTVKIVRRGERRERTATKLRDAKSSRQPLKPVERKSGK
jgi:membrane-associated protease RseP (regulator of RpoE activity)